MKILSVDCAEKTLAVIVLEIRENLWNSALDSINNLFAKNITVEYLKNINDTLDNVIKIISACMISTKITDVPALKRDVMTIQSIKRELDKLDLFFPNMRVLIEYQMSNNFKSRAIQNALIMYFSDYDVELIMPSLKNKFAWSDALIYQEFARKYKSNYTINKKHCEGNFVKYLNMVGIRDKFNYAKLDDISDAFMQAIAWYVFKYSNN